MIKVNWEELLEAFTYVNFAPVGENSARLSLDSGKIELDSVWTDMFDAGPSEEKADEESLGIPHKTELGLGRELVLWFVEEIIPDHLDDVADFFQKRGAYARFKALLAEEGLLQQWYQFEKDAEEQALRNWCEENGVQLV
jgi:hypothetical protein